jgi:hypothetical protein
LNFVKKNDSGYPVFVNHQILIRGAICPNHVAGVDTLFIWLADHFGVVKG